MRRSDVSCSAITSRSSDVKLFQPENVTLMRYGHDRAISVKTLCTFVIFQLAVRTKKVNLIQIFD